MKKVLYTNNSEETYIIGKKIGERIEGGMLICLCGDLGAGKTVLVKGIAEGLGIDDRITSPTFNIVKEYQGREKLLHFDVYRISDPEEMFEIGFDEYLKSGAACVIEWAELIEEILPENRMLIEIFYEDEGRRISIEGEGQYKKLIEEL